MPCSRSLPAWTSPPPVGRSRTAGLGQTVRSPPYYFGLYYVWDSLGCNVSAFRRTGWLRRRRCRCVRPTTRQPADEPGRWGLLHRCLRAFRRLDDARTFACRACLRRATFFCLACCTSLAGRGFPHYHRFAGRQRTVCVTLRDRRDGLMYPTTLAPSVTYPFGCCLCYFLFCRLPPARLRAYAPTTVAAHAYCPTRNTTFPTPSIVTLMPLHTYHGLCGTHAHAHPTTRATRLRHATRLHTTHLWITVACGVSFQQFYRYRASQPHPTCV